MGVQITRIARHGASSAILLEQPMLDLLGINEQTDLKVTAEGGKLIVEPISEDVEFRRVLEKTGKENAELFRRLAK